MMTDPRVILIGTSNSNVQLLWALCICQLDGSRLLIDPSTGNAGKTDDWFYWIRDFIHSGSDSPPPPALDIEYFDGLSPEQRSLFPGVLAWYQVTFAPYLVDTMIDSMLSKGGFPSLQDYLSDPSAYDHGRVGWMYDKMARHGIDDTRDQLRCVLELALGEIELIKGRPNTHLIDMFDLFDEDACIDWVSRILERDLPRPDAFRRQHRAWRFHNADHLRRYQVAALSKGVRLPLDIPVDMGDALPYVTIESRNKGPW